MLNDERIQDACEALRARIAELMDERNAKGVSECTTALDQMQIQWISEDTPRTYERLAKTS